MRNVAIVGSGIAALTAAHAFRKAGYAVTLHSDRSARALGAPHVKVFPMLVL